MKKNVKITGVIILIFFILMVVGLGISTIKKNITQTTDVTTAINTTAIGAGSVIEETYTYPITTTTEPTTKVVTTTVVTTTEKETEVTTTKKAEETTKKSKPTTTVVSNTSGKYGYARKVWNALKNEGLNDYVCAGIMGNLMAETGGQTLNLDPYINSTSSSYYGICQWGGSRKSRLLNNYGSDIDAQVEFLCDELFEYIPRGSSFYDMTNVEDTALYIAKHYEVCSSRYYGVRQSNAHKAYNYFVG